MLSLALCFPAFALIGQSRLDSMLQIIKQNRPDTIHAKTLVNLGLELERRDTRQAKAYMLESIKLSENNFTGRWLGIAYIRLAGIYSVSGDVDSAQFYFEKAEKFIPQFHPNDLKLFSSLYTGLGIHFNRLGDAQNALENYFKVEGLGQEVMGIDGMAGNYLNISNVYSRIPDEKKRQDYIFKALELFETSQNQTGLSFCYNALGNSFYTLKDYDKALYYYEKSLAIREQRGDNMGKASVLNNMGNIYMDTEQYAKALEIQLQAAELNKALGLRNELGINYINTGKIYQKEKNRSKALEYFLLAKNLLEEMGVKALLGFVYAELGRIYSELNQNEKATEHLLQSVEFSKLFNDLKAEATAYDYLVKHYQKVGNYKSAFETTQLHNVLKDSLEGIELKSRLNELETKYETGKKEAEIALLKAQQELKDAELEKQRAFQTLIIIVLLSVIIVSVLLINRYRVLNRTRRQLEMEKMRSQIARDLHDDIGSTLSSINIISNMALANNDETKNYFQNIQEQSSRMMDNMADIVWSINPNNDTLEQVVIKMKEFAAEILEPKNINYSFQESAGLDKVKLDVEKRKNLFLIFKESINNAAKYSGGQNINIQLITNGADIRLLIKDDGKGFNMDEIKPGNGLKNMEVRAELIGAKLSRNSSPGLGTSIELEVPIT